MREQIKDIAFAIFHPGFWFSNYPISDVWDGWLRGHLEKKTPIKREGKHTISINGTHIWTSNYPFSFGSPYDCNPEVLPKRRTRKLLFDILTNPDNFKIEGNTDAQ